jgi:hypothetical protein
VWQSVKVTDKNHPRAGEAGTTQAIVQEGAETVPVKFDSAGEVIDIPVDSVQVL